MKIKEHVFVVTGANSGLGKATTEKILQMGGKVIAIDRSEEILIDMKADASNILKYSCDIREEKGLRQICNSAVEQWGGIQGGIHCAGIAPAQKIYSSKHGSHSFEKFQEVIAINLLGSFNFINTLTPYLIENSIQKEGQERGCLILTSSIAASEGQIGQIGYAASKAGVNGMILPAARELAQYGIRVNGIAPGIFQTAMVSKFPLSVQENLAAQIPFPNRLGAPAEYADLAVSILENPMINGTVIRIDGGVRMH